MRSLGGVTDGIHDGQVTRPISSRGSQAWGLQSHQISCTEYLASASAYWWA